MARGSLIIMIVFSTPHLAMWRRLTAMMVNHRLFVLLPLTEFLKLTNVNVSKFFCIPSNKRTSSLWYAWRESCWWRWEECQLSGDFLDLCGGMGLLECLDTLWGPKQLGWVADTLGLAGPKSICNGGPVTVDETYCYRLVWNIVPKRSGFVFYFCSQRRCQLMILLWWFQCLKPGNQQNKTQRVAVPELILRCLS